MGLGMCLIFELDTGQTKPQTESVLRGQIRELFKQHEQLREDHETLVSFLKDEQ